MSLNVLGLDGVDRALGILASAFGPDDILQINRGIIRPTAGPPGMPNIMRNRWTLEEQVADAFKRQGRSVNQAGWVGYVNEPKYEAYKKAKGGGKKIGIWKNSERPLDMTFRLGDPDHIEEVTIDGFEWGSKRYYAYDFHIGQWQRWDQVDAPGRQIIDINERMMLEVARAHQRYVVGKLRSQGQSIRNVRVIL